MGNCIDKQDLYLKYSVNKTLAIKINMTRKVICIAQSSSNYSFDKISHK